MKKITFFILFLVVQQFIFAQKNQYADFLTHYAKWRIYNNIKELKQNAKDASKTQSNHLYL